MTERILLVVLLAGCQPSDDVSLPPPGDSVTTCRENQLELLTVSYGDAERYYVAVELDGSQKALQLDTGSSLTFLFTGAGSPDYQPDIATLTIGCEIISVAGRGYDVNDPPVSGLEVVGLLGMEFLLGKPSLLDVDARRLTRFDHLDADQVERAAFSVPFDNVIDHALVPLTLDGATVRLLFDTGGDTVLVGAEGNPGDTVVYVEDFEGNIFPIYQGTGSLVFAGQPARTVFVARAPEFPYFQQTVDALGGNLHGLLGVTAFPGEKLLVDGEGSLLWVIP